MGVAIFAFVAAAASQGWDCDRWKGPVTATTVLEAVRTRGASETLALLRCQDGPWEQVIAGLDTGRSEWLQVALALVNHADGGQARDLNYSLSGLLPQFPAAVLRLMRDSRVRAGPSDSSFWPGAICGNIEIVESRKQAYDLLRRQEKAVRAVKDSAIPSELLRECLQAIEESRASVPTAHFER